MQRYIIEFIGTFFLTLAIVLTGMPLSIGIILMAMFYIGSHISGAHFNSAISIVMWFKNRISNESLLAYLGAQIAGSFLALLIFYSITKTSFAPEVIPGMALSLSMGMEFLLTLVFCWVVASITNNMKYASSGIDGLIIGLTYMAIAFIGGLFNPSIGAAIWLCNVILGGSFTGIENIFIFVVAPFAAAIATPYIERACRY